MGRRVRTADDRQACRKGGKLCTKIISREEGARSGTRAQGSIAPVEVTCKVALKYERRLAWCRKTAGALRVEGVA